MSNVLILMALIGLGMPVHAQTEGDQSCTEQTKTYNNNGFEEDDFLSADGGILVDNEIRLDTDRELDLENLVLGLDQPFFVDYLSEGAGASHLFGFFFFDLDTDKDGIPDFYETEPGDDLDGDGILNQDDTDDDNDGIPDGSDTQPAGVTNSMPASYFRNGTVAADNGVHAGDYWQFVPNNLLESGDDYDGFFEHPGAYLYVDNDNNEIPDMMQYVTGANEIPPYVVDRDWLTEDYLGTSTPGFLGNFFYSGTPGGVTNDKFHWIGSTVFYIADDDGGSGQTSNYNNNPYRVSGSNLYSDISGSTDANPDYYIYGTSDPSSDAIPSILKEDDGSPIIDGRGVAQWRYRWYSSNISGSRELVFFLVVFWGSGGSNVNTYYSKSGFNRDNPPGSPNRQGATTGDHFGGSNSFNNWYPSYRSTGDHNTLAQAVYGQNWSSIATAPTDGTSPVAHNPANQDWVDEWENWRQDRRIIQYRALRDWFNATAVDANDVINGRYGIDMSAEGDSSLIRAFNNQMVHLMVGAPSETKNAWLLGWEDLFSGGDRDFEDVVFYVKREAGGQLQSLNVVDNDSQAFDDFSLTQVSFEFVDNFTEDLWGQDGRYVNYYYRLAANDEWIPLLGGQHQRDPDLFQPGSGGATTEDNGRITRSITIEVQDKKQEIYWKVEMATDNVDTVKPKVFEAEISYQTLVHDFYYNSAVIPNSNIRYVPAFQTPDLDWEIFNKNRGHLYAVQTFNHGNPLTPVTIDVNPENTPEAQPGEPFKWDAGVTMKNDLDTGNERKIYTYLTGAVSNGLSNQLTQIEMTRSSTTDDLVEAFDLTDEKQDNIWVNNFHEPDAVDQDKISASIWLQNWIHGYSDPLVADGAVQAAGPTKEWLLGGINRASVQVVRAPGLAPFVFGSDVDPSIKRSYVDFITTDFQLNLPTRLLIGSEAGLVHMFDAGSWVGRRRNETDIWADGHYLNDNFGTGSEVWSYLPGHLLEDVKFNYTGANTVTAKVDATAISAVIQNGDDWTRVAFVSQGFKGGTETVSGNDLTGNAIFALDITDPDNPTPLWERVDSNTQDMINPPSIGWVETSGGTSWMVAYSSGATPVTGQAPAYFMVDALTGQVDNTISRTVGTAGSSNVMVGTPALLDTDTNGYIDHVVGATSEGILFVTDLKNGGSFSSRSVTGARFFHTPNVRLVDGKLQMFIISSDHPFVYDESFYASSNFTNTLYGFEFDPESGQWSDLGTFDFPTRHKPFARPALVGSQLVVGTSTGDTLSICDVDPADPGRLMLIDTGLLGAGEELQDEVSLGAPIAGSIMVYGREIHAHVNNIRSDNPAGSPFQEVQTDADGNAALEFNPPVRRTIATVFGTLGWQNNLLRNLSLDTE
ncbi:DUF4114 domain-containing protein [Sulfidibacter corallicola]|uniref:DUF4114 domain-containing protein n=1 Tax=Sulfidibacter corallicola TaxID=2818388 RepID=A0A8A4TQ27_SULCO|nr:DUF4114 domain-containing protein [Sulfidibacter corallicola]QTD52086.1 DUF4114 domain-containing protein [Sulfidibacter corallicola]